MIENNLCSVFTRLMQLTYYRKSEASLTPNTRKHKSINLNRMGIGFFWGFISFHGDND